MNLKLQTLKPLKCFDILSNKDFSRDIHIGAIRVGINVNENESMGNKKLEIEPFQTILLHSKLTEPESGLPPDNSATLKRAIEVSKIFFEFCLKKIFRLLLLSKI